MGIGKVHFLIASMKNTIDLLHKRTNLVDRFWSVQRITNDFLFDISLSNSINI